MTNVQGFRLDTEQVDSGKEVPKGANEAVNNGENVVIK